MSQSHSHAALPEDIRLRFRSYINSRTGLYFSGYDLKDIDAVIVQRMKACSFDTVIAYYNYLTASENREDELRELLNRLTINHTYFFRNESHFRVLKEKILPELIERKLREARSRPDSRPSIKVWSAGCSTGEEPYSIAMTIKEAIPDIENWDIHILATDASTDALDAARGGAYGANSVRLVEPAIMDRYFIKKHISAKVERYEVTDEIKKMVSIGFFNLMDEDFPGQFDMIFCRNVTIYFETETTTRVINKFETSMDDNGYLFIGYSETLQYISDKFKMIDWGDAIYYVKMKGHIHAPRHKGLGPAAHEYKPVWTFAATPAAEIKLPEAPAKKRRSEKLKELIAQAVRSIHAKDYETALSIIRQAQSLDENDSEPYFLSAEVYANQGRIAEARDNLAKSLEKDAMFAPAYYLYGSLYNEEGHLDEAEMSFRKALYLEKHYPLAHLGLANIYKERGMSGKALREYRNTLADLSILSPYDIITHSGGFNASTLSSVCKDNIERLKMAG